MKGLHVPDKVPSFSSLDQLMSYVDAYTEDHPELLSCDEESGEPCVDLMVRYDVDLGQYVFDGFVPAGYRRHGRHGLTPRSGPPSVLDPADVALGVPDPCGFPVVVIRVADCQRLNNLWC